MNKKELAAVVADKCGLSNAQAGEAIEATLDCITHCLKNGEEVRLLGFGNFVSVHRKARTARNPQTGAPIDVPAADVPKFKPGKALKEAVNS
ncbi:MAG: HU family DNA-binding protein [Rhizobiaceae bacterium]|nr:HU family DNA-binding protein [Rhizobiaceae bacterium]